MKSVLHFGGISGIMSTSTYYNFINPSIEPNKMLAPQPPSLIKTAREMNQIDQRRQTAVSPASLATSTSDSSSSLNSQFNSLTPGSIACFSSTYSSSSSTSSSSSSSAASTTNLVTTIPTDQAQQAVTTTTSTKKVATRPSVCHRPRELMRQASVTPTGAFRQHQPSQLIHSYTLHSLEPKPLKPFRSSSAYIDAMKEDLSEWLNSIYDDLELTPENFFSQLETGNIICRHANNVTRMGRNLMVEQSTAPNSDGSDSEMNSFPAQNILSSFSPECNESSQLQNPQLTFQRIDTFNQQRHRHSTANSSLSSISTATSRSTSRQRLSLSSQIGSPRTTDRTINWFRVKVIPYKNDAKPGTFFARDNICQFILWCRSLNILECLLFETDDLVARKNKKSFILCLLEVARIGFKVGMPTPLIIQLEQEIDREIENDAKLKKQLEEDEQEGFELPKTAAATKRKEEQKDHLFASYLSSDSGNHYELSNDNNNKDEPSDGSATTASVKRPELNNNDNEGSGRITASFKLASDEKESDPKKSSDSGVEQEKDEDEFCLEDFGPKPQRITNDLLSLHERVSSSASMIDMSVVCR